VYCYGDDGDVDDDDDDDVFLWAQNSPIILEAITLSHFQIKKMSGFGTKQKDQTYIFFPSLHQVKMIIFQSLMMF
jgi:hypothetical protein